MTIPIPTPHHSMVVKQSYSVSKRTSMGLRVLRFQIEHCFSEVMAKLQGIKAQDPLHSTLTVCEASDARRALGYSSVGHRAHCPSRHSTLPYVGEVGSTSLSKPGALSRANLMERQATDMNRRTGKNALPMSWNL
ncbi:hypothetical protein PG994_003165 [Apiospora phragmitis]|uniref:Transposase n=1 Tax=Apiospora phragmitis TaxID=2905665 RepID=A0ABR1VXD3_9PEZI